LDIMKRDRRTKRKLEEKEGKTKDKVKKLKG
jgi:hypothetical protein